LRKLEYNFKSLITVLAKGCYVSPPDAALDICATCGELLKALRRRARLSQRELSIAVGYSESHISRIERNERPIDRASLLALFVPALHIEKEPALIERLLTLCYRRTSLPADEQTGKGTPPPVPDTPPTLPSRLPIQLTSFIGRTEEVAEVCALLRDGNARLLTLTGAGGCGKTRLALRVGELLAQAYAQGVWLVELAVLADAQLLPNVIAATLCVGKAADDAILAKLTEFLSTRQLLLILDNCEHLIEAVAHLTVQLLQAAPQLQIMSTSRAALAIPGEINYRVQPLALPPAQRGAQPMAAAVAGYDAIQLFVQRARSVLHTFVLTDQNAGAVARICQRLDGIPLGIELAAAWVNLLAPEQIASRLEYDFDHGVAAQHHLLVDSNRLVLPRHQTLRAALDWSYHLLAEAEQKWLRGLAVFAGGWHLAAAAAVVLAADEEQAVSATQVLLRLNQLVNQSLVTVEHSAADEPRYRLLEPIRQYLAEKLAAAGEEPHVRSRHLHYFAVLATGLETRSRGAEQVAALRLFDREQDNFRAALTWGFSDHTKSMGDRHVAAQLAAALGRFWSMRQQRQEGRAWLAKALASFAADPHPPQPAPASLPEADRALYAKLLFRAGSMAKEVFVARQLIEQSLALWRSLGDQRGIARALQELATIAQDQGDVDRAMILLAESLEASRTLGDDWLLVVKLQKMADLLVEQQAYADGEKLAAESLTIARRLGDMGLMIASLNILAQCAIGNARYAEAVAMLEEGLALDRQRNPQSRGGPWSFRNLGLAWQMQGEYEKAAEYYRRSLHFRQEREEWGGMAWALEGLGEVETLQGDPVQAARLWGMAAALRRRAGSVMSPSDRLRNDAIVAKVCAQLGSAAFKTAWAEGEAMAQSVDATPCRTGSTVCD
jgi:predicted ATPase/transcriptional regulator with XRE-family HTH domain